MKKHKGSLSVKWKLFGYFFIFSAVLIALLWLTQTVLIDDIYRTRVSADIKAQSGVIAENIDNEELNILIEGVSQNRGSSAQLIDEDGNILYTARHAPGLGPDRATPGEEKYWELAQENGGQYVFEGTQNGPFDESGEKIDYNEENFRGEVPRNDQFQTSIMVCATIIERADGSRVLLLLSSYLQPLDATVSTLRAILTVVSVVMAVLSALLALLLSKKIARPIIALSSSAKELAEGNYAVRFEQGDYNEINELSDTLSYAAGELSKLDKLHHEFIANVSHDMRTPLTMISGYGEAMRDIPGENTPENVQIIIDEAGRLSELVTNILDLSRLESGLSELRPVEYDLADSLGAIAVRFAKLSGRKIDFSCCGETAVCADEGLISRAAYNLLSNADAHTPDDGEISVAVTTGGGMARVAVSDTGEGVPAEQLDHIWERYARGPGNGKAGGTGLGLAIVRSIVAAHGGKYGVDSTEGAGSVFWFAIPLPPKTK